MTGRDPLVLLQEALDDEETRQFLAEVARRWPRMAGAHVADVLEHTTDYDLFLDATEPFFDEHEAELFSLPDALPVTAVLHLLIIMGRELTMANLLSVLGTAGLLPAAPSVLRWRRVVIENVQAGWSADGADLHYLVFRHPQGNGYLLTRYPRNGQHTADIISAASWAAAMTTADEGRRTAELFEAGEDIPEIGWFHGSPPPGLRPSAFGALDAAHETADEGPAPDALTDPRS